MNDSRTSLVDRIAVEAAEWFEKLHEGTAPGPELTRFSSWLAESPVHVREYLAIVETWGSLQAAGCWPEMSREELLAVVRAVQPSNISSLSKPSALATSRGRPAVVRFAVAAALALVGILATWGWFSPTGNDYSTARGEQRSVVLDDGSVVQLNTLTKMKIHFDHQHRRIVLPRGEAFFRVAPDASRPFEVETPFARVRAIGTEFNVYNQTDATRVAVIGGRVQVTAANSAVPVAVAAAQSVEVSAKGKIKSIDRASAEPQMESPIAWIQRRIVLDDTPLDAVVAEFNRYNKLQMQIDDPSLGTLRITGVFSADDPLALTKYLSRVQNVEISKESDELVLRRKL